MQPAWQTLLKALELINHLVYVFPQWVLHSQDKHFSISTMKMFFLFAIKYPTFGSLCFLIVRNESSFNLWKLKFSNLCKYCVLIQLNHYFPIFKQTTKSFVANKWRKERRYNAPEPILSLRINREMCVCIWFTSKTDVEKTVRNDMSRWNIHEALKNLSRFFGIWYRCKRLYRGKFLRFGTVQHNYTFSAAQIL